MPHNTIPFYQLLFRGYLIIEMAQLDIAIDKNEILIKRQSTR